VKRFGLKNSLSHLERGSLSGSKYRKQVVEAVIHIEAMGVREYGSVTR
jgi:hypothetical protein